MSISIKEYMMENQYGEHKEPIDKIKNEIESSLLKLGELVLDDLIDIKSYALPNDFSDKTKNKNVNIFKNDISRYLLIEKHHAASYNEQLQVESNFFHEESIRKEKQRESLSEFEGVNAKEENTSRKWTNQTKKLAYFYYLCIGIAIVIELLLSYNLLTTNIVSFFDTPWVALTMGFIPIFAAFLLKFIQRKVSISKGKKQIAWGVGFIMAIFLFLIFQFVMYSLQLSNAKNGRDEISTLSRFEQPITSEGGVSPTIEEVAYIQWEKTYYFFVSLIIGAFIFVVSGALSELYASHKDMRQRTLEYENLVREHKYCLDAKANAEVVLARCLGLCKEIDITINSLSEKAWDLLCQRRKEVDNEKVKKEEIIKVGEEEKKHKKSLRDKRRSEILQALNQSGHAELLKEYNRLSNQDE